MKKRNAAWIAVAFGLMLAGCGQQGKAGTWNADTNSIYVDHAMGIKSAMVYTSEQDNDMYNQDELKAYAEAAVIDYNTENGAAALAQNSEGSEKLPVALKSCKLEGKKGTLVFDYADGAHLVAFSEESGDNTHTVTDFSVMKVSDALVAGQLMDGTFVNKDGAAVSSDEVIKQSDCYAIAVEGAAKIQTEGVILYVTEGVTKTDSYTAVTPEGKHYIIFQ